MNIRFIPERSLRDLILVLKHTCVFLKINKPPFGRQSLGQNNKPLIAMQREFLFMFCLSTLLCSVYESACSLFERLGPCVLNLFSLFQQANATLIDFAAAK